MLLCLWWQQILFNSIPHTSNVLWQYKSTACIFIRTNVCMKLRFSQSLWKEKDSGKSPDYNMQPANRGLYPLIYVEVFLPPLPFFISVLHHALKVEGAMMSPHRARVLWTMGKHWSSLLPDQIVLTVLPNCRSGGACCVMEKEMTAPGNCLQLIPCYIPH